LKNFAFTRHEFLFVTVKEWLKSVLITEVIPQNKSKYPFLDHPVFYVLPVVIIIVIYLFNTLDHIQGGPKKVSHYQISKKSTSTSTPFIDTVINETL